MINLEAKLDFYSLKTNKVLKKQTNRRINFFNPEAI